MTAKLSDELVDELERAGDQPLRVENPRNHKLYVIIAEERLTGPTPADANGQWTEAKNARRFALIDKEIAGTLSQKEAEELAGLSREIDDYLLRVAPLPIHEARELHEQLRRSIATAD
ncbi:MAG: hypothetical protein L0211_01370 [Planctomycetaceae bacterium]|nr:hypothetical protein [Planctomycetaceae bacterium]